MVKLLAVYVDVLFLKEMLVDGSLLLLTAWVRGVKAKPLRVLSAAAIGGLYVVSDALSCAVVFVHDCREG